MNSNIELTNPEFSNGGFMPGVHTCYGLNRSPELSWTGVPSGTLSLTLVISGVDSPNKPNQIHWVLYNLPHDLTITPSNISITKESVLGGTQGQNDFNGGGWHGPCPERGGRNSGSYIFDLYDLNTKLDIESDNPAEPIDIIRTMGSHVIGHGQLMAKYCQSDASWSSDESRGSCLSSESEA